MKVTHPTVYLFAAISSIAAHSGISSHRRISTTRFCISSMVSCGNDIYVISTYQYLKEHVKEYCNEIDHMH